MDQTRYLTIKALTTYIKRKFDFDPHLTDVYVKGEISNFKRHSSGHLYFTLKDESSRISAVMFAKDARKVLFQLDEGMNVLIKGRVTVYEATGQYQIYVERMEPDGVGALYLAYEQLKRKLEEEGLFHFERKKAIPKFPTTVGVVTSATGAAVRDIITTIKRRYPLTKILLFPTIVQGKSAAPSIVESIKKANEGKLADVLIVGRGGGSIEDLWAFNEEIVARAIYASDIPIISAVGHETDTTIADFVADDRAPTPTAAAEIAVPDKVELLELVLIKQNQLYREMSQLIKQRKEFLDSRVNSYVMRTPENIYMQKWEQLDRATESLNNAQKRLISNHKEKLKLYDIQILKKYTERKLELSKEELQALQKQLVQTTRQVILKNEHQFKEKVAALDALSPLNTLKRGFSVAHNATGHVVKQTSDVAIGEQVELVVTDGTITCTVNQIEKGEKNE